MGRRPAQEWTFCSPGRALVETRALNIELGGHGGWAALAERPVDFFFALTGLEGSFSCTRRDYIFHLVQDYSTSYNVRQHHAARFDVYFGTRDARLFPASFRILQLRPTSFKRLQQQSTSYHSNRPRSVSPRTTAQRERPAVEERCFYTGIVASAPHLVAMAPHLTSAELNMAQTMATKNKTPSDILARLSLHRARKGIDAPGLKVIKRALAGRTFKRGLQETRPIGRSVKRAGAPVKSCSCANLSWLVCGLGGEAERRWRRCSAE